MIDDPCCILKRFEWNPLYDTVEIADSVVKKHERKVLLKLRIMLLQLSFLQRGFGESKAIEDCCRQECDVVQSGRNLRTLLISVLHRSLLPPSRIKMETVDSSTRLHGVKYQKTNIITYNVYSVFSTQVACCSCLYFQEIFHFCLLDHLLLLNESDKYQEF